ncbi:NADH-dependent flavin oxidoreductase [Tilletia horrida]|uniref:NADH-dependent flavin oxidoreductase n=1 Tax=Tilletia horrida TaxID=155126 RepID=A0AAN6GRY1_9BASI|nr:NADH-dependent flavin oxidoreductase [Tilletia horrida]KAK0553557.1 NADH-dependent flavin oxidoreductase [Tilletia horrida]
MAAYTHPAQTSRYDSADVDVSVLGEPIKLPFSGKVAKNRFLKAAMTERQSSWDQKDASKRGVPSESLINLYKAWGQGGFGIILSGNLIVDPYNLEAPGNTVLSKELANSERLDAFKKLAAAAKADGSLFIVQVSHGGRQVAENLVSEPVSASDVKLDDRMGMSFGKPRPLSVDDIKQVVQHFADTAELSHQIGADGVQLHGAHGYLLAQFLASSTNKRTDQYGGSLENRSRIVVEIIEAIKARVPSTFSISLKLNAVEFQTGGFSTEDCADLCAKLESLGVDWVELSGGTYEDIRFYDSEEEEANSKRESTKKREAFFLKFADIIRPQLKQTRVYVTGGFRTAEGMVRAVQHGSTEGIGLARPAAEEPDLPKKILSGQVKAAVKTLLPPKDFGIQNVAAGTAMRQIGEAKTPTLNTGDGKHIEQFQKRAGEFFGQMGEEGQKGIVSAGYPAFDLVSA